MLAYPSLISESASELLALERSQKKANSRDRIRFIRLLKTGQAKTQGQAGELIGIGIRQSQRLWSKYHKSGLLSLSKSVYQGYWGKLSSQQLSHLQCSLTESGIYTQEQAAEFIEKQYGVKYKQSGICRLFKRLKIKLKTGRPQNIQQDEAAKESFKKTLLS